MPPDHRQKGFAVSLELARADAEGSRPAPASEPGRVAAISRKVASWKIT